MRRVCGFRKFSHGTLHRFPRNHLDVSIAGRGAGRGPRVQASGTESTSGAWRPACCFRHVDIKSTRIRWNLESSRDIDSLGQHRPGQGCLRVPEPSIGAPVLKRPHRRGGPAEGGPLGRARRRFTRRPRRWHGDHGAFSKPPAFSAWTRCWAGQLRHISLGESPERSVASVSAPWPPCETPTERTSQDPAFSAGAGEPYRFRRATNAALTSASPTSSTPAPGTSKGLLGLALKVTAPSWSFTLPAASLAVTSRE